jgi:molybdopterin converting factor small subunit
MISDVLRTKKLQLDVGNGTVKDILDELIRQYGKKVGDGFCDSEGNFDVSIQTVLNGNSFITVDQHSHPLIKEGDTVTFMLLLAGG